GLLCYGSRCNVRPHYLRPTDHGWARLYSGDAHSRLGDRLSGRPRGNIRGNPGGLPGFGARGHPTSHGVCRVARESEAPQPSPFNTWDRVTPKPLAIARSVLNATLRSPRSTDPM